MPTEVDQRSIEDNINTQTVSHGSKRRREDDHYSTDDSSDFYGFAADSFIFFSGENVGPTGDTQRTPVDEIRRSKRRRVKKNKSDYVYY